MRVFKRFIKWFLTALIFLSLLVGFQVLSLDPEPQDLKLAVIILLVSSAVLSGLFLLLEFVIVPKRKRKMMEKVLEIFQAKYIDQETAVYEVGGIQFLIRISLELKMSQYNSALEIIQIHVPRNQYDWLPIKPNIMLREDLFNNIPTYLIFTVPKGHLKKTKEKLDRMVVTGDFI